MSSPVNAIVTGRFSTTAAPAPVFFSVPCGVSWIKIFNDTGIAAVGAGINAIEWKDSFPANTCIQYTGAALVPAINNAAAGGLTFIADTANPVIGPAIVNAAGITNAAPPVVTSATLYPVGSVIRLYNTTAALQLAGMDYEVTVSGAGTMTLGFVATAPGSAATANTLRLINPLSRYYPRSRYITGIIADVVNPALTVVALSVTHGFTVGQQVRLIVPQFWGITALNGVLATIVAIGTAFGGAGTTNTITLNVDITGMTPFAYPTTAQAAVGVGFPQIIPVGEAATVPYANLLDDATRNQSETGILVNPAVLVASNNYSWVALKGTAI